MLTEVLVELGRSGGRSGCLKDRRSIPLLCLCERDLFSPGHSGMKQSHHSGLDPQKPVSKGADNPIPVYWEKSLCAVLCCTSSQGPVSSCLPDSLSSESSASSNKPTSPWPLRCQTSWNTRGTEPSFFLFPVDINPHTHKPLATCIVIVIKLMP